MTTNGLPDAGPGIDRRDYGKLPERIAGRLRAAWRDVASPHANTPRGYPFPLRSWPPDAAIDIQYLAEAIDADITTNLLGKDTGWRDVATYWANGWSGQAYCRRIARTCIISVIDAVNASAANTFMMTWPAEGFNGSARAAAVAPTFDGTTLAAHPNHILVPSPVAGAWLITTSPYTAGLKMSGQVTYVTDEGWPTTLPGTPA